MSVSVGGLGLLSSSLPFLTWSENVHARSEFRSFVFALVIFVVVLILAYLTNPSETSFRAYLTEQSFRQHLSRLDDPSDDVSDSDLGFPRTRHNATLPFHFASRASVSLRTPKHVFHSLGICTIATTRGNGNTQHHSSSTSVDQDGSVVSDSWFVGAFGHWWRGGLVESWYHRAMTHSKDAEGWSSGILGFKALDKLDYNRFPFASASAGTLPSSFPRIAPKLRNRERSASRLLAPRSSTPPPLPKTASLPLHADHHRQPDVHLRAHTPTPQAVPVAPSAPATPDPHPSQDPAQTTSPQIAEVLRQISSTQTSIAELRVQLTEVRDTAAQSHSALQAEVEMLREEKKTEDAKRAKGKTEAKALEEAKRSAEGAKKEAEKKLKRAERAREDARRRIEELEQEIKQLNDRAKEDRDAVQQGKDEVDQKEREMMEELEEKKKEVKVAEDVVAALNLRAKEFEDRIAVGQERLRRAKERAEAARNDLSVNALPQRRRSSADDADMRTHGPTVTGVSSWVPTFSPFDVTDNALSSPGLSVTDSSTSPSQLSRSPRPARLSLGALSNFSSQSFPDNDSSADYRSEGYTVFDDDITSLSHRTSHSVPSLLGPSQISPSVGITPSTTYSQLHDSSESSTALIPSSLISVLDLALETPSVVSLPFYQQQQHQSDLHLHASTPSETTNSAFSTSPESLTAPMFGGPSLYPTDTDAPSPFEVRMPFEGMGIPYRTHSDPTRASYGSEDVTVTSASPPASASAPRRWFSTSVRDKEKPRKGLNPDAKVFHFSRRAAQSQGHSGAAANVNTHGGAASFDALNPSTTSSASVSSGTSSPLANLLSAHHSHSHSHPLSHTSSSLLRAFAPSRAERRALVGLTNTSLERLPSLSDVGSIPSSPSLPSALPSTGLLGNGTALDRGSGAVSGTGKVHSLVGEDAHANRHSHGHGHGHGHGHAFSESLSLGALPAWLATPPIIRKLKFSPFSDEDEDSEGSASASGSGSGAGEREV